MGSVQATYSPLQAGAAPQLDALQLAQMCAMGFPRAHAQHALAATHCSGAHAWLRAAPAPIRVQYLPVPKWELVHTAWWLRAGIDMAECATSSQSAIMHKPRPLLHEPMILSCACQAPTTISSRVSAC